MGSAENTEIAFDQELHESGTSLSHSPDGLDEAQIDALLADVDRELATDERVMTTRLRCSLIDGRSAHRAHRRVVGEVLRSLPTRLPAFGLVDGEAA